MIKHTAQEWADWTGQILVFKMYPSRLLLQNEINIIDLVEDKNWVDGDVIVPVRSGKASYTIEEWLRWLQEPLTVSPDQSISFCYNGKKYILGTLEA